MESHAETIQSISADVSEKRILTASSDGVIRVMHLNSTTLTLDQELFAHRSPATKAIFISKGEFIVSSDFTGFLIIWKLEGAKYNMKWNKQVCGGPINSIAGRYQEDKFIVYCACSDGNIRILEFDVRFNYTETVIFGHRFGTLCISCNDEIFVTGGADHSVVVWKGTEEIKRFRSHTSFVRDVSIAPSNCFGIECFASCAEDGKVIVYVKEDDEYRTQALEMNEPCYSIAWSKSGFVLTVAYGEAKYKSFVADGNGDYKEIPLDEVTDK